jgi:hypothetical protein
MPSKSSLASYRDLALKLYPWICGRCGRSFTHSTLRELTVHHRDHNHDNNPEDGSNWELLCLYCHDQEHQRQVAAPKPSTPGHAAAPATSKALGDLKDLFAARKKP